MDDDAEAYRYRIKNTPKFSIGPGDDSLIDMTIKDIRGFDAREGNRGIRFTNRQSGALAFVDVGHKISLYEIDDASILASLQLGAQKWGAVSITGSDEYKRRCVELATANGIKITNPELRDEIARHEQLKKIADIEQKFGDHARTAKAREVFSKYHDAVCADWYRVTATQIRDDGTKRGFVVNATDGAPDGFTASEMAAKMPRLLALQDEGRNIFLTPMSGDKHHILVDDLDHEDLAEFLTDGYEPAAIIETSPNNFQAIITIPKLGTPHDREIANELVRELNKRYGDPKRSGSATRRELIDIYHAHRAPGFENRKPKHRRGDGTFPETRLVKAQRVVCQKTLARAKELSQKIAEREKTQQSRISDIHRLALPDKAALPVMKAFAAQFRDVYAIQKAREEKTGRPVDMSRIDSMAAVRLRATGQSKDAVRDAIQTMSPSLRYELGMDADAHNWHDYAARTADYAFGKGGERSLAKFAKSVIDRWRMIESPQPQKPTKESIAPPKPLSAEADKARLAELSRPRDEFANEYAREKIAAADAQERARDQKFLAEAQRELDEAKSAYQAHIEADAGITLFDRLWNKGRAAREKQAAYDEERGRLDLVVQHAEHHVHNIKYGHIAHIAQDARKRRDDDFYRDGCRAYDAQHPVEARERAILQELYEVNMIGYVSDPISQPSGHKRDAQRVARIMEIEKSRGLTEQEVVDKHEGVRRFFEMAAKYRGREIERCDRDFGR